MKRLWFRGKNDVINDFMAWARYETAPTPAAEPPAAPPASGSPDPAAAPTPPSPAPAAPADWRASLDPDIKDHPCLASFKDPKEAIKAYVGAQRIIGAEKLPMPPKDAKPEVREKFMNDVADRLGRPKTPAEYKIPDVKLPDGVKITPAPAVVDSFKAEAHKLGLLPHQVEGMYKFYMGSMASQVGGFNEAQVKARQDAEASLRQEWGAAYDAKVSRAQGLLNKVGGDDIKAALDKGFGNDPAVVRFMAKMADMLSEDSLEKGGAEGTMTPQEAKAEIMKVNEMIMKTAKTHPDYKDLLRRKADLYAMAYPEPVAA